MISYTIALLSPLESFDKNIPNIPNIPNDNCVELQVKTINNQLKTQGANKSFNSARTITLTTQVLDDVKMNLLKEITLFFHPELGQMWISALTL